MPKNLSIDDACIVLAPYVWKRTGAGTTARAEAPIPGAYIRAAVGGTSSISLLVDGAANDGCPPASMPVIETSVDEGPFTVTQLTRSGEVYALRLAEGLDAAAPHRVEVLFRGADLAQNRWRGSTAHLRIAGIELDAGGTLQPCPTRARRAIGFGDSITEGVGVDGLWKSWPAPEANNARATWFPMVSTALDAEYGQLGSSGQGMMRPIEMPVLGETWHSYDPETTRLTGGLLAPEPDYVMCAMGTNDFDTTTQRPMDIAQPYTSWLAAVRAACPTARFFCVIPPLGWHAAPIASAVATRRAAGDLRVHLIDTAPLSWGFGVRGATRLALDGVHPTVYGQALLAALIAAEIGKIIRSE